MSQKKPNKPIEEPGTENRNKWVLNRILGPKCHYDPLIEFCGGVEKRDMKEQLLDNMDIERERKLGFKPLLTIAVEDNPPRVRVTDNGPGISPEYAERVFDLFFSLKDKSRRRGLGLFIAREAAEHFWP